MNTTGKKRMLKLAAFLRELPRKQFKFSEIVKKGPKCGTVGCAMGWTPVLFPHLVKAELEEDLEDGTKRFDVKTKNSYGYTNVAREIFDIQDEGDLVFDDEGGAYELFTPGHTVCGIYLDYRATPKQVARRLEKYVAAQS